MAPLPKLAWFHEERPDLAARVRHWVGIKDYVLLELLGVLATDHSNASGTGLLDIHALQWDPEALQLAAISAGQLPELVPTTKVLLGLSAKAAHAMRLPAATPVIAGAGDGPLANLGPSSTPAAGLSVTP
jgi:gluconokinase